LSGVDVARKILILIRESGYQMDIEEIENNCFLPKECMETTNNADFFESLSTHASHFDNMLAEAKSKDSRIKFVASFDQGKASVVLQFIPKESPFYNLEGKDTIVEFYTDRYIDQPLIIKGDGAVVTASGIFADAIRIGNN
jgi:aspartokinase/homoserine dehydrogenase 1